MPWLEWGHGRLLWRWTISGPGINVLIAIREDVVIIGSYQQWWKHLFIDLSDLLTDMVAADNS